MAFAALLSFVRPRKSVARTRLLFVAMSDTPVLGGVLH